MKAAERKTSAARSKALMAVGAALASGVLLVALEIGFHRHAARGIYFHPWTSDHMMQVVSVIDLRDEPLRSLWYLHIQPPLFDFLRTLAARAYRSLDYPAILDAVDRLLLVLWNVCGVVIVGLVCRFLLDITTRIYALACALLLMAVHPALVFYSTYLDSTVLSALLVTWFYFELWKTKGKHGSPARLTSAVILLFMTRSIFQLPFLAVVVAALALRRCPRRRLLTITLVAGGVMGLYLIKQHWLFGVAGTSTFAGYNGCRSIDAPCDWNLRDRAQRLPELPDPGRARVLRRVRKPNGEYNFNQIAYLRISFAQMDQYVRFLRRMPLRVTLGRYLRNVELYLRPSSRYDYYVETRHALVERLPWRTSYDWLFSGARLALLILGAIAYFGASRAHVRGLRENLGLLLPGLYVFLVSVVFEGGENMRFKFFLEPIAVVLLSSMLYDFWRRFGDALKRRLLNRSRLQTGPKAVGETT